MDAELPFITDEKVEKKLLGAVAQERAVEAVGVLPFNTSDEEDAELIAANVLERAIEAAGGAEQFEAFKQRLADGEQVIISEGVEVDCTERSIAQLAAEFNWAVNRALITAEALPSNRVDERFFDTSSFTAIIGRVAVVEPDVAKLSIIQSDGTFTRVDEPAYAEWVERINPGLSASSRLKNALEGAADQRDKVLGKAIAAAKKRIPAKLKTLRAAARIERKVDMFAARTSIRMVGKVVHVVVPFQPFVATGRADPELVEKYIADHFVELNQLLGFLAAARFAASRRECFVWFHACSDFGKSLIFGITGAMDNLKAVVEFEVKELVKALDGDPSGMEPEPFERAWMIFVDEFKAAASQLKKVNEVITFAGKGKPKVSVPVFTKVFASAEDVQSLTAGGVETQFDRRFCVLVPKNAQVPIFSHDWFNEAGPGAVREALEHHIADFFNAEVERYRAMGKAVAETEAKKVIEAFRVGRLLTDLEGTVRIEDEVQELADDLHGLLRDYYLHHNDPDWPRSVGPGVARILSTHVRVGTSGYDNERGQPAVFVSQGGLTRLINDYLKETLPPSSAGKLGYKMRDIKAALKQRAHPRIDKDWRVRFVPPGADGFVRKRGLLVAFGKPADDPRPIPERTGAELF